ncbi:maltose alpha-D-glucosyltransferase [Desertibaculum subflavum]|uniref:maltose alpha-D-glucosyltransferase n=1 Tax=Desertibaculum subflavum TaxID=2268458 RepID=UPI000E663834
MLTDEPLWFKDVIVYEAHVKAFFDGNDDGVGDFQGLIAKLDYLQDLGVNAIWILPFYPSPLRDDGYDIADYREVHPSYGTMKDFRLFVREAHKRGLRVITELVINHTSDQHPWFQRARLAKSGSPFRNWYVWSDTDKRYTETRIIFSDTEKSNWTWDPAANAYYWHRFFSHQPDLNFDNPQVMKAVVNTMRFWFDSGVDGMRLDAIPYLVERDGTNNENLAETHAVLKHLRAELDKKYRNRMFLAEANQWPEDSQAYFGNGDECHMAYHFPLMPRMYMAIAQEDRHPITDIMRQTPDIPESCQWAIFLRNHDELTLEMVTDAERDYLWNAYAADRRARLNLGIRRRLAPLMDNDRRKIELMNSLLMSMPGSPILYYGDEIGMGDNIFLGDRDGVRTPMQWTPDRNGGFSRADPARLYLPPLMDPVYGFQAVNVEAQSRAPSSFLNWMKRLIAARQARKVFGRGTLSFLYPSNRRIFAYIREYEDETVLCVANLARSAEAVDLDLAAYRGRVPVELLSRTLFPQIGDGYYRITLSGHSFFWFLLCQPTALTDGGPAIGESLPEFVTLVMGDNWQALLTAHNKRMFERDALKRYLPLRRWYGAKDEVLREATVAAAIPFAQGSDRWMLSFIDVRFEGRSAAQRYFLPLATDWREVHALPPDRVAVTIAKVRKGPREGALYEAVQDERFAPAVIDAVRRDLTIDGPAGQIEFRATKAFASQTMPETLSVRPLAVEQSNSSILIDDYAVLKFYRRLATGIHPDLEVGRFLTETAGFANTPALLGTVELKDAEGSAAIAAMHAFIRNQGDGWSHTLSYLQRHMDDVAVLPADEVAARADPHAINIVQLRKLGERTAELHRALCPAKAASAFAPQPLTAADVQKYQREVRQEAREALEALGKARRSLSKEAAEQTEPLLAKRRQILDAIMAPIAVPPGVMKTRYHGDYHLGQVIVAQNDFYILDFEGEPRRPLAHRRAKHTPLKDVAGMLRSFDYAAWSTLDHETQKQPERRELLRPHLLAWRDEAGKAFLAGYREAIGDCASYPSDEKATDGLLKLATLEKAFYEIGYELANRPNWLWIPLAGVNDILFRSA